MCPFIDKGHQSMMTEPHEAQVYRRSMQVERSAAAVGGKWACLVLQPSAQRLTGGLATTPPQGGPRQAAGGLRATRVVPAATTEVPTQPTGEAGSSHTGLGVPNGFCYKAVWWWHTRCHSCCCGVCRLVAGLGGCLVSPQCFRKLTPGHPHRNL